MPERKQLRLRSHDYTYGWYFVTICTKGKKHCLGHIVGGDAHIAPHTALTKYGCVAEKYLKSMPSIADYVIMPNHVHFVVSIGMENGAMWASPPTTTLGDLVRSFKTLVTKTVGEGIWQRSYYDHIIRDEADYLRIRQYIAHNPARWTEDKYYDGE